MKKAILAISVVLLLCCATLTFLFIFKGKELFPNLTIFQEISTNENTGTTQLELTMTEFPRYLSTICQRVEFSIEAKNTGKATLKYSDITNETYGFSVLINSSKTIVAQTLNNSQGTHSLYLEDFGEIKPGETKNISFYTKETYLDSAEFGYRNGFNMLQSLGNGPAIFIFEFYKNNGRDSYTMLSNTPMFTIDMQAFEKSGEYWSNKICD